MTTGSDRSGVFPLPVPMAGGPVACCALCGREREVVVVLEVMKGERPALCDVGAVRVGVGPVGEREAFPFCSDCAGWARGRVGCPVSVEGSRLLGVGEHGAALARLLGVAERVHVSDVAVLR